MSDGIFSRLIEDDLRKESEARSEEYVMVNVRPGEKVGAMLDLMVRLTGKTPSALLADKLPETLADHAASSVAHGPAILEAAARAIEHDGMWFEGALALLREQGVIEEEGHLIRAARQRLSEGPKPDQS